MIIAAWRAWVEDGRTRWLVLACALLAADAALAHFAGPLLTRELDIARSVVWPE